MNYFDKSISMVNTCLDFENILDSDLPMIEC